MNAARSSFKGGTPIGAIVSQIGWDPAAGSAVLTLLPAGHAAGMYEVLFVLVVRTVLGATPSVTLSGWTTPTFGADAGETMSFAINGAGTGTSFANTNTSSTMHRAVPIMSTGATALTFTMQNGTSGLADIYACARLIAV